MEWGSIIGSLAALLAAVLLPLALKARKKGGPQKVEQLLQHLADIGVSASLLEKGVGEEKVGVSRASGQRSEGVIQIAGRNIDYINVVTITSQYGVRYFLDYLVRSPRWSVIKRRRKTRMVGKKRSGIRGRIVDVEWKGDDYLARELNYDYSLKDRLLGAGLGELKGGISVFPEPKHEYVRVRTTYLLPSSDLFQAMDMIARHVKSGW